MIENVTRRIISQLRYAGVLQVVDRLFLMKEIFRNLGNNSKFRLQNPEYPLPSFSLAFDACGHVNWPLYHGSGIVHASLLAEIIKKSYEEKELDVFEWGCGPARVLRHLQSSLRQNINIYGSDINSKSIEWCREKFPKYTFITNDIVPPLAFDDEKFDVIIARSVFTHLSRSGHYKWISELQRVLRQDGIIILSSQGNFFRNIHLDESEKEVFDSGDLVVRDKIKEGLKWYSAFHPELFMQNELFKGMKILLHQPGPIVPYFEQDLWVVTKNMESSILSIDSLDRSDIH